jgi:CheY-like chemotaxis protein
LMPEMDGFQLCHEVRATSAPAAFLSSSTRPHTRPRRMQTWVIFGRLALRREAGRSGRVHKHR